MAGNESYTAGTLTKERTVGHDNTVILQNRHLQRPGDMLIVSETPFAKIEPCLELLNLGMYKNPLGF